MDYPSNSQTPPPRRREEKPEPKKVEKVISGTVVKQKKPLRRRMAEIFVGGDVHSVGSFLFLDVLVPAVKDTFADIMTQGVERMMYGEVRSTSRRYGGYRPSERVHTNYGSRYSTAYREPRWRDDPRNAPQMSRRNRATHNFEEIILATRVEAEMIIDKLADLVDRYESATVKDLYDLVGESSDYTDDKYGWIDMRGADVVRVNNGYLLDLPRPVPLD